MVRKVAAIGVVVLVVVVGGFFGTIQWRSGRTFEAPYPRLAAIGAPEIIERGRYLAYGPAHCAYCHVPNEQAPLLEAGEEPPMIGGHVWEMPFGRIVSPNLTPDEETGIGRKSDAELARILRHGVRADGRVATPLMEFHMMADDDVVAILSFLRSQEPVRSAVDEPAYNFLGRVLLAFVFQPFISENAPPTLAPPEEVTVERGAYLANNVAGCAACHTAHDLRTGQFTGAPFAGGGEFGAPGPDGTPVLIVSPNITSAPTTGVLARLNEDQFVRRFHEVGRQVEPSPMPWGAYAKMSETDLRAMHRYLMTVEPIENDVGPVLR